MLAALSMQPSVRLLQVHDCQPIPSPIALHFGMHVMHPLYQRVETGTMPHQCRWLWQMDTAALEKKVAAMTGGDALGRARKGLRSGSGSKAEAGKAGASEGPDDSIRCRRSTICEGKNECPSREPCAGVPAWQMSAHTHSEQLLTMGAGFHGSLLVLHCPDEKRQMSTRAAWRLCASPDPALRSMICTN